MTAARLPLVAPFALNPIESVAHGALHRVMGNQDERRRLALLALALNEQAILRVWLTCLGCREKLEHVAHLFCELHQRLRRIGLVGDHTFDLPLTQELLAQATGMSAVHVNRVIQRLRKEGLIALHDHHLVILEPKRLRELAEFDTTYLAA